MNRFKLSFRKKSKHMASKKIEKKHDIFCWTCNSNEPATDIKCTKCIRSFHKTCCDEEEIGQFEEDGLCTICVTMDSYKFESPNDTKALKIILDVILENDAYDTLKYDAQNSKSYLNKSKDNESIVNAVNLKMIEQKIDSYTSYAQFLVDFLWIRHNCCILYSESHKLSKDLIAEVAAECESAKQCSECYTNANEEDGNENNWFNLVCSKPHLLVWAKIKGSKFWPAKMMETDGVTVFVRFFGDCSGSKVQLNNCFLYSEQSPEKHPPRSSKYAKSLKMAELYGANIRKHFGAFQMFPSMKKFDPKYCDKYIQNMISEDSSDLLNQTTFPSKNGGDKNQINENPIETISEEKSTETIKGSLRSYNKFLGKPPAKRGLTVTGQIPIKISRLESKNDSNIDPDKNTEHDADKSKESGQISTVPPKDQMLVENELVIEYGKVALKAGNSKTLQSDSGSLSRNEHEYVENTTDMVQHTLHSFKSGQEVLNKLWDRTLQQTVEKFHTYEKMNSDLKKENTNLREKEKECAARIDKLNKDYTEIISVLQKKYDALQLKMENMKWKRSCMSCEMTQVDFYYCSLECHKRYIDQANGEALKAKENVE